MLWQFPNFTLVWEHALGLGRGPEARSHGVAFCGSQGVLVADRGGWEVFPETGRNGRRGPGRKLPAVAHQPVTEPRYDVGHVKNFLECLRSRQTPHADIQAGFSHAVACCMSARALDTGRRIRFDRERLELV